ncbi:MAG: YgiT-type zinc finger protein [Alphaproteobacteria bacterium]|jgi:YgiT-type zinc finger domain-containing protein|nr:YgiT-type zinc finger protein [Alphaproteobacteria bacterium]
MKCVLCKQGDTASGLATVVLTRGESTVVLKNVPADICSDCGEYYLSEDMSRRVMERAEAAVRNGVEVEIVRFAA